MVRKLIFLLALMPLGIIGKAQVVFTGQVTDSETGEPIPFVNILLMGTDIGTTTDFDGFYKLVCTEKSDSIRFSYLGYETKMVPFPKGGSQVLNVKLNSEGVDLEPLKIVAGENPAHRIIRAAQERRKQNNPYSLTAWECQSFTKVQIAIDNVSENLKKRKVMQSVAPLFDTISYLTGDNGKQVLPMFISETISDFYLLNNPRKVKEYIRAVKIKGVGIEDGSLTSQLLGSTFQQYNFFENWSLILDKDFVSPIAAGAFGFYDYRLMDSLINIDGYWTYQIEVRPKRPQDLAFTGFIWITDSSFALKRVALEINAKANLNFIEKLRIQQENVEVETGQWVPSRTRVTIDIAEITNNTAGLVAQFYNSNKNYVVNKPHDNKFYEDPLVVADTAQDHSEEYWEENRHEKITDEEKRVYSIVDSVRNNPIVKTYVEIVDIAVNGYFDLGKIEVGPYALFYGYNALEGNRFRLGFKTSYQLSKRFEFYTYGAYGTLDERWKYSGQLQYTASKKSWTKIGFKHRDDVDQIGITDSDIQASNLFTSVSVFQANQLNRTLENKLWIRTDINDNWQFRATFHNKRFEFEPIGDFNFSYFPVEDDTNIKSSRFTNTTLSLQARFSYQELFLINDHDRISLGALRGPNVTLEYKKGLQGTLDGDFNYDEVNITVSQKAKIGVFGNSYYTVKLGKIWGTLPYPILSVHRGNESFIATTTAFNLMNFFEFASDRYVSGFYEHHFEGLLMNRVPGLRKAKLRSFIGYRAVWGDMSQANRDLLPDADEHNRLVSNFETLNNLPYMELNYGIENIFKLGRIEAIHRLTHLQKPGVSAFGIKVSLQLEF